MNRPAAATERENWLEMRRHGIGASDAAAVLGVSPWKSPLTLYCEKLGIAELEPTELEALEWGLLLETPIAERYQRETGRTVIDPGRFTVRTSDRHPFMLASLDREVRDADRGPGVLEIKTTSFFRADEWADEAPLHYQVQVQHQLAVTGYSWGSLAVLIGGQRFYWTDIARNDRFIEALIAREAAFWEALERREPPAPDASEACRDVLKRLYPTAAQGKVIALQPDAAEWDRRRLEAIAAAEVAKTQQREAENYLIAALGDAEVGLLADGTRFTYKQQSRAGYTVKPSTFRVLRRLAAR